jgi:uncharacterized protein YutE (UPF0331/DUF86 family)
MTQGHVDLKVVSTRLEIIDSCLGQLRSLPTSSLTVFLADTRNPAAAESLLRRTIEALLDIARHLLAKVFGEGPLEYRQVARRAMEQGLVLDQEVAAKFFVLAGYRNRMTHFYADVTPEELFEIVNRHLDDLVAVAAELRQAATRLLPATPKSSIQ